MNYIVFGLFAFGLLMIVITLIRIAIDNKKLIRENKAKQDRYLEPTDIPGEEMDFQYCEHPFIDGVTCNN